MCGGGQRREQARTACEVKSNNKTMSPVVVHELVDPAGHVLDLLERCVLGLLDPGLQLVHRFDPGCDALHRTRLLQRQVRVHLKTSRESKKKNRRRKTEKEDEKRAFFFGSALDS